MKLHPKSFIDSQEFVVIDFWEDRVKSQRNYCPNYNHRRSNAPVRFCPNCGEVVNKDIPIRKCSEAKHAKRRRERNQYCLDCGEQLVQER